MLKENFLHLWARAKFLIMLMSPFWLASIILLVCLGYVGSFIFLNQHHLDILDNFMLQMTQFGDGALLIPILVFIFIWKKPELVITIIIASLFSCIVTYLCKTYLFADWNRPLSVIGNEGLVHTVNHYQLFKHSFPSGHTICVTTVLTSVALSNYKSRVTVILIAMIMLLVSYSRIYLGAHFLGDVLAGSLIGILISLLTTGFFLGSLPCSLKARTVAKQQFLKIAILALASVTLALKIYCWKQLW
nr:phosphatase PAP2 family protein [Pedobacter panaciterrae]